MEKEQKLNENVMLSFIDEIHQQTEKMCIVGPGPYGFGIANSHLSDIGMVLSFQPSPVKDHVIFPEDIPSYEVSVQAFSKREQKLLELSEAEGLLAAENPATSKIAGAVIGLSKESRHVTRDECVEAFDVLARQELGTLEELGEPEEPQQESQGPILC